MNSANLSMGVSTGLLALAVILACNNSAPMTSAPPTEPAPVQPTAPATSSSAPDDEKTSAPTPTPQHTPDLLLPIAARNHAPERPEAGWCAETAIQEALLYYGAYAPQRLINKAGKPRHPDLYWSDVPVAMRKLGLKYQRWSGDGDLDDFMDWIEEQLDAGRPVIAGVKIHPTEHPSWGLDHMVLIVGYEQGQALYINTTWGHRKRFTRKALATAKKGIAFHNRSEHYFAYAIKGLPAYDQHQPTELRLAGTTEDKAQLTGSLHLQGLVADQDYELLSYSLGGKRPTIAHPFTATAAQQMMPMTIDKTKSAVFRYRAVASDEDRARAP